MQNISFQSDVLKYVDIWQRKHAASVLEIFTSIFNDIEELLSDSDLEESMSILKKATMSGRN